MSKSDFCDLNSLDEVRLMDEGGLGDRFGCFIVPLGTFLFRMRVYGDLEPCPPCMWIVNE